MQDLVAEYQQYQDATYVLDCCFTFRRFPSDNCVPSVEEEEVEYEEEVAADEEQ